MNNTNALSELTHAELQETTGGNAILIGISIGSSVGFANYMLNNWADFKEGVADGFASW